MTEKVTPQKAKNKFIHVLKVILIFPYLFDLLKNISQEINRAQFAIRTYLTSNIEGQIATFRKMVKEETNKLLNEIAETPYHNTTYFFSSEGLAYNLNLNVWTIDIDYKPEELKAGIMTIFFRYGQTQKIIEKFKIDFKMWRDDHPDKDLVNWALLLLGDRKDDGNTIFNYAQFRLYLLSQFVEGTNLLSSITYQQLNGMVLQAFVDFVKPLYEDEKRKEKLIEESIEYLSKPEVKKHVPNPEVIDKGKLETLRTDELAEIVKWAKEVSSLQPEDPLPKHPESLLELGKEEKPSKIVRVK